MEIVIAFAALVTLWLLFDLNARIKLGSEYKPPSLPNKSVLMKWILAIVLYAAVLALSACATTPSNFVYQADDEKDIWKIPQQTLIDGFGDCDDWGLLYRWLLIHVDGVPSDEIELIYGKYLGTGHLVVSYNGRYFDQEHIYGVLPEAYKRFKAERTYTNAYIHKKLMQGLLASKGD
jgi:hypothetical protein